MLKAAGGGGGEGSCVFYPPFFCNPQCPLLTYDWPVYQRENTTGVKETKGLNLCIYLGSKKCELAQGNGGGGILHTDCHGLDQSPLLQYSPPDNRLSEGSWGGGRIFAFYLRQEGYSSRRRWGHRCSRTDVCSGSWLKKLV